MNQPVTHTQNKDTSYSTAAYTLRMLTPAFLGDADQNGRWRTPPIKALLRQWWRVAYAAEKQFAMRVDEMRHEEGLLFGHAWLENDTYECNGRQVTTAARKSLIRLRLNIWETGKLDKDHWPDDKKVVHPEVKNRDGKAMPVGSNLYLGYGPLAYDRQKHTTVIKANAAIQAEETATFSIAFPQANASSIVNALWLMDRYGTLGGRSRNGWGSFVLTPVGDTPKLNSTLTTCDWRDCLNMDWPHAVGHDNKGALIWQTEPMADWRDVMKRLAELKIGLRTQFGFSTGKNVPTPEARHWLSYPVTNHSVSCWDSKARLPNTLRFKVRPTDDDRLVGVIFHVPHLPPKNFNPERKVIEEIWSSVHRYLDDQRPPLQRSPA